MQTAARAGSVDLRIHYLGFEIVFRVFPPASVQRLAQRDCALLYAGTLLVVRGEGEP